MGKLAPRKGDLLLLGAKNIVDLVMMVVNKRIAFNTGKRLMNEASEKKKLLSLRKKYRELNNAHKLLQDNYNKLYNSVK